MTTPFKKCVSLMIYLLCLLGISSCQKEDAPEITPPNSFEEVTHTYIASQSGTLSDQRVLATDAGGQKLEVSDVFFYKTKSSRYGKLEILAIDSTDNYSLTIRAVTFQSHGAVYSQTSHLKIRGTYPCDLDDMVEGDSNILINDFWWERETLTNTYLNPVPPALFAKYEF